MVDQGTPVEAAGRIIILEDQLEEALRINAERSATADDPSADPPGHAVGAGQSVWRRR
jgi:hypothetical protein